MHYFVKVCKILKKHFLTNMDHFRPRKPCCIHLIVFMCYPCFLMIYSKKSNRKWATHCPNSPQGVPGEIRTFSENCTSTSSTRGNKLKPQKTIFPIFPKNRSGTCRGPWEHTPDLRAFTLYLVLFVHFYQLSPGDILVNFGQNGFSKISKKMQNINYRVI